MKKRILAMLLCTAMVVSTVAGCGSSSSTTEEATSTEASSESSESGESSGEVVTLTFSHLFVEGESFHDIIPSSVEAFNADYAGQYEIIIEEMPQESYLTQTNALGTADELSELVFVNGSMMTAFSETGVIIPLTDVLENIGLEDILKDGIIADGTNVYDNTVYSLPIASGTYGFILYNTEIFEEVGIESFPETMDELYDAIDLLTAAGYTAMGLGISDLWASDSILFSAFVNNYVGTEWFNEIRAHSGEASFTDAEFIEALTAYQDLATYGMFNSDFVSISNDERLGLYLNGQVAMMSAGDWECMNVVDADPDLGAVTLAATWPSPDDSIASDSIVQSAAWGIAMGSKITDEQIVAAEIYLKDYFFTQDNGRIMIEDNNEFVAWEVEEYDETALSTPSLSLLENVSACTGCMNWDASLDATVKEVYQRGLQELLMGSVTPEELAADMQEEYDLVVVE